MKKNVQLAATCEIGKKIMGAEKNENESEDGTCGRAFQRAGTWN